VPKARIMAALFSITLLSLPIAFVGVASAQTGYPPGTTTTSVAPGGGNAGTVPLGGTITATASGFSPGSSTTLLVDGQAAGSVTVGANGVASVSIKVLSATTALVNGVSIPITCGANSVTFTGTSPTGAALTQTISFSVNCAVSAGIVFTGANVFKWLLAALVLLALGALFLIAERRRSRTIA
jgi:hypothetical protein